MCCKALQRRLTDYRQTLFIKPIFFFNSRDLKLTYFFDLIQTFSILCMWEHKHFFSFFCVFNTCRKNVYWSQFLDIWIMFDILNKNLDQFKRQANSIAFLLKYSCTKFKKFTKLWIYLVIELSLNVSIYWQIYNILYNTIQFLST